MLLFHRIYRTRLFFYKGITYGLESVRHTRIPSANRKGHIGNQGERAFSRRRVNDRIPCRSRSLLPPEGCAPVPAYFTALYSLTIPKQLSLFTCLNPTLFKASRISSGRMHASIVSQ